MAVSVALIAIGLAVAQGAGDRPRGDRQGARGERRAQMLGEAGGAGVVAKILDELELTDEQKQKIEKMRADFEARMKDMGDKMRASMEEIRKFREENPNDQEGLRKKRQEMMDQVTPLREAIQGFVEQVKAELNEEQLKKFEKLLAERGGPGGMGGRMGQGGRMGMGGQMGLPGTDPKLQEDLQLTDQQKEKLKGLVQAYAEEQRQLLEKYTGLIKEMLTPEQQEKFEKAVTEMKNRLGNRMGMGGRGQRPARPAPADNPPPPPAGGAEEKKPAA
jgi:Spy/CpxP family protein refolding chaperone